MRILITGGAGFIGSNFIKYIFKKQPDWQVVNLDKLTYAGNLESLKEIENDPNYKFVKGDIASAKDVERAIDEGVDKIINYAAETHVDRSIISPDAFIKTDIFGTYTLLEAVKNIESHNIFKSQRTKYLVPLKMVVLRKKVRLRQTVPIRLLRPAPTIFAARILKLIICRLW